MRTESSISPWRFLAAVLMCFGIGAGVPSANAAATIVISNQDGPGEGFNDPTPATPVGSNPGTTLGQQRLIAFQYAANIWGATLTSSQIIVIRASFDPLTCTASSGVLGSAGAYNIWRDFPGAPKTDTWYPQALANKISNSNLSADDPIDGQDIRARFNSRLGLFPDCLPGSPFYLGIDNNHGPLTDLVTVLLHELGHGLGFQTFTSGATGEQFDGSPSIWDHYLFGADFGLLWKDMTDAQRAGSAISIDKLVWTGASVNNALPGVLTLGTPALLVSGPAAGPAAGSYAVGTASFGNPLSGAAVTGQIMPVVDQPNGTGLACNPLSAANARAVSGNVALVSRGVCGFVVKVKNAQDAGAIAVLVADNAPGAPPPGLGGSDSTIVIPAVRITQADGLTIKAALAKRSRTASGVIGSIGLAGSRYQGADALGRMQMFAPNPLQQGSSVSHFDATAFRNQLMEPAINGDLTHAVTVPQDLTFELFKDIGW